MAYRYKSSCCCDEKPKVAECFLGFGTVPSDMPWNPSKDRCIYENRNLYSSSKGENPYIHWSFCSGSRNEELILTLERDVSIDSSAVWSTTYDNTLACSGNECAECVSFFQSQGINCGNCSQCCQFIENVIGPPSYFTYSTPNSPFYVRYRRLRKAEDFASEISWQENVQNPHENVYVWRTVSSHRGTNGWSPALNGGNALWPLYVSPFSPDANPRDQNYPHGTAVNCNCQAWNNIGACEDAICSTVPNIPSGGYQNWLSCNPDYRGASNLYLTPAQVNLIGASWNTNDWGYVSAEGWAKGDPCFPPGNCDDDPDTPDGYIQDIYEQGGKYFWLQGIANHNDYDPNEEKRYFRDYVYVPGVGVIQIYSSSDCNTEPFGLWNLNQTLLGVFHRETWWEKYWNGYTRGAFERLDPQNIPPDQYFQHNSDSVVDRWTPSMIGFSCAGIPVFSWEIHNFYNGPFQIGSDILNYKIPDSSINKFNVTIEQITNSEDTVRVLGGDTAEEIRQSHLLCVFLGVFYGIAIPEEVTRCLEAYDILPQPLNYGEEQDYKIFKKKIRYYKGNVESQEFPCCINTGSRIPIGNCGITAEDRETFGNGEMCELYPEYCPSDPGGCISQECVDCVVANGEPSCTEEWDGNCVNFAQSVCSDVCTSISYCIDATPYECKYIYGGQTSFGDSECPGKFPFIIDHLNQQYCDGPNGNLIGSCCFGELGGPFDCSETNDFNCTGSFTIHTNCAGDGQVCYQDDTGFPGWDSIEEDPGCSNWSDPIEEDFYFYGRPGGWAWYSQDARPIIQQSKNLFPSYEGVNAYRNNEDWRPWASPIELFQISDDPYTNGPDSDLEEIAFNYCCRLNEEQSGWYPGCYNSINTNCETGSLGADQPNPDDPDDPELPRHPVFCSDLGVSITCRGAWFQWQLNDYGPADEFGNTPHGCDSISNSFWLRQDPYEYGDKYNIDIRLNSQGVTSAYINSIETDTFDVERGIIQEIDVNPALNSHETFRSLPFEATYEEDGQIYVYESQSFEFYIGTPDTDQDGLLTSIYTYQERLYSNLDNTYEFNPFEQLDSNTYTKCRNILNWQIQEVFRTQVGTDNNGPIYDYKYIPFLTGTINVVDPLNNDFSCGENIIKYSGEAARMFEYQWYHPPYIRTTGSPAREYSRCADISCDDIAENYCGERCCNTKLFPISTEGNFLCPIHIAKNPGPAGSYLNRSGQPFLPPPPE